MRQTDGWYVALPSEVRTLFSTFFHEFDFKFNFFSSHSLCDYPTWSHPSAGYTSHERLYQRPRFLVQRWLLTTKIGIEHF
jgi:hypothetical protein